MKWCCIGFKAQSETAALFGRRVLVHSELLGPKNRQLVAPSVRAGQMRRLVTWAPKVRQGLPFGPSGLLAIRG